MGSAGSLRCKFGSPSVMVAMVTLAWAGSALGQTATAVAGPSFVKIVNGSKGSFTLTLNGQPYFIRGACGGQFLEELHQAGGNSVRTWAADKIEPLLDRAHALGLTVCVGLWVGHKAQGFDYANESKVREQFLTLRSQIRKLRSHPAVLLWAIGNEMEADGEDPRVWQAVESIARMAHEEDANHPTVTALAEVSKRKIDALKRYCPSLDAIGMNSYAGLSTLANRLAEYQWNRPYLVTEFGPNGAWEVQKTDWGAPIEASSTDKANHYLTQWLGGITSHRDRCLGGYAFYWGNPDQFATTHTWFNLFLPEGKERLGGVDALTLAWTGSFSSRRAPEIVALHVDGALQVLAPSSEHNAQLTARDVNGDSLRVVWEVREEAAPNQRSAPSVVAGCIVRSEGVRATLRTPAKPGAYRLFTYVFDGQGGAATANAPFFVASTSAP